jgi:hypothetical protein
MGRSVRHLLRVGVVSGALAFAAVGVGVAPAGATVQSSGSGFASSPLHVGDECTFYNSGHYVGSTTLLRLGNHMMVIVSFSHAIPNAYYPVYLYEGTSEGFCDHSVYLGTLHTSPSGTASGGYFPVIGQTWWSYFFVASDNYQTYLEFGTYWNESALFHLPPGT